MSRRPISLSFEKLRSDAFEAHNVRLVIGGIVFEEKEWEPMGPAPKPPYHLLRLWDYFLFRRYTPTYVVRDRDSHIRTLFSLTIAGTSHFIAVARSRLNYAYRKLGEDAELKLGLDIEAPLTRTLIGIKPTVLSDLEETMSYVLSEYATTVASVHSNNESYYLDYESKMFHLGMLSLLAAEVAELAYMAIVAKKGIKTPQQLEWGPGVADLTKPTIMVLGDAPPVLDIVEKLEEKKLSSNVEIVAAGCYALDMWKLSGGKAKIVALQPEVEDALSCELMKAVDVVVVGEYGAVKNLIEAAKRYGFKILVATPRACLGLPDLTLKNVNEIVDYLSKDDAVGAVVLDPEKLAEVAISLAVSLASKRSVKKEYSGSSTVWRAKPPLGAFPEEVVRSVGVPVVMGTMPGVVAVVGCAKYPKGVEELGELVETLAKRSFLVLTVECTALAISKYVSKEMGEPLYSAYPDNIIVVGSPTSIAHIAGLAIKVPAIFAKMPLRGNGPAVLDYILNRVPAVGLAWSTPNEMLVAMAWGVLRAGVPIVVGPALAVAGRLFLGDPSDRERYTVFDNRTKQKVFAGPIPEHLLMLAKNPKEAAVLIAKHVMRLNDGHQCRSIKVSHYIDLYEQAFGTLPPDLDMYIRSESDIPITRKSEIEELLRKKGWKPMEPALIDPTVLPILLGQV